MKHRDMDRIIESKYKRYTANVINQIKALPPESRLSGDDSGLANVWEEWKVQMQGEQSVFFDQNKEMGSENNFL